MDKNDILPKKPQKIIFRKNDFLIRQYREKTILVKILIFIFFIFLMKLGQNFVFFGLKSKVKKKKLNSEKIIFSKKLNLIYWAFFTILNLRPFIKNLDQNWRIFFLRILGQKWLFAEKSSKNNFSKKRFLGSSISYKKDYI